MTIERRYDKIFLITALILLVFGLVALSSSSLGLAARENKGSYYPLLKQIILGSGLGVALLLFTSRVHYKSWKRFALPLFLFSFLLTFLVLAPYIGFEHGGAKRWLSFGGFTFQPSEFLKLAFVVYLSYWLSQRQKQIPNVKTGLIPFLIIVGFVGVGLVIQPDIGTLGVISITAGFMFFLAGGRLSQIGFILLLGLLTFSVLVFFKPYLMSRVTVFFDSSHDLQGAGYQINQAKIAMGSGGVWGRGLGEGLSKFNYLPEPTGDSIFAVIGEELGFVGTSALALLFLFFFFKAMQIAIRAPDLFGRLLASGIAILIIVQSFINMYAVVGLIPLTGLPLVFISQGGSSLIFTLAGVGIILNVSKYT